MKTSFFCSDIYEIRVPDNNFDNNYIDRINNRKIDIQWDVSFLFLLKLQN